MKHLETKREAAERRRVTLMSKGIADFLERTSRQAEDVDESSTTEGSETSNNNDHVKRAAEPSILDKIRTTLDHAAEILRTSLELTAGGVVFLDTKVC